MSFIKFIILSVDAIFDILRYRTKYIYVWECFRSSRLLNETIKFFYFTILRFTGCDPALRAETRPGLSLNDSFTDLMIKVYFLRCLMLWIDHIIISCIGPMKGRSKKVYVDYRWRGPELARSAPGLSDDVATLSDNRGHFIKHQLMLQSFNGFQ